MKKQEFINITGAKPKSTEEAIKVADNNNIRFGRRNAHLKAWFGKSNGNLQAGSWNLVG